MARIRYAPEQIIYKLREAEVLKSQGLTVPENVATITSIRNQCGQNVTISIVNFV